MATNPVVSLPDADAVRDALGLPFVVVSDVVGHTDTTACACPACRPPPGARRTARSPISERRISRQRAFPAAPGEARPDWWIVVRSRRAHGLRRREAVALAWYGFAVVARRPETIAADYWALARSEAGWRIELGGKDQPADWQHFARRLFGLGEEEDAELLAYGDADIGSHRFAAFAGARPLGVLYVAAEPVAASRAWVCQQFGAGLVDSAGRRGLLVGRPSQGVADPGLIVCSCFAVGRNAILAALASGAGSIDGVGSATSAGTNCGSCRAEIQGLIDHVAVAAAE
jgi:bacterioferritin-associated ferredoxin